MPCYANKSYLISCGHLNLHLGSLWVRLIEHGPH